MEKVYDLDVRGYDIETPRGGFLWVSKCFRTGRYWIFRVDRFVNQLEELIKYLKDDTVDYYVGYNILKFDAQVVQFILDNHHKWYDFDGGKIAKIIAQFASDVIDDTDHGLWPPYREEQLWCKQIDLFTIHHFDNKQRSCSLKWAEFSMNMDNIEDMPIDIYEEFLTEEQLQDMVKYCCNDNDANEQLYWVTRGITDLEEYEGKDIILDTLNIIAEKGLPTKAINYSNVKIGDELNKIGYCKRTGIKPEKLYEIKAARKSTAGFTYGDCIPGYVKFKTEKFHDFMESVKGEVVNLNKSDDDEEGFRLTHKGTTYVIKKGGIHSNEGKRRVIPLESEILRDADIGSQYPNAINKRGLYPSHLGPEWNEEYRTNTHERTKVYKPKAKKGMPDWRRYAGVAEKLKYALNGGGFGKTNEKGSWQYDPFVMYQCTIGNQFEILMLIEDLEEVGIHVVSANTDGIVCLFDKSLDKTYYDVCEEWERKVGNDVDGRLEYADYSRLIQTSVNVYIAQKTDGSVKKKGVFFLTSHELNKNKSRRIIPLALEKYFMEDIPVEETIRNHKNVWDFVIGTKGNDDYYYRTVTRSGERVDYHSRVIRYLVTKQGVRLLKMKRDTSDKPGPEVSNKEKGKWLVTVYNNAREKDVLKLGVDFDYYIEKAKEVIQGIENPKRKKIYNNPDQISLF